MEVDLEEIDGFAKNTVEFTVLVNDDGMGESEAKLDFHYGRGERRCVCFLNGLHNREGAHATASDEVDLGTFETSMGASLISVDM